MVLSINTSWFTKKRDKANDLRLTEQFLNDIEKSPENMDKFKSAISILKNHPYMLEFQQFGKETQIVVHSPVNYLAQSFNKQKVCSYTDPVVALVKTYDLKNNVVTSDNVSKMCDGPNVRNAETSISPGPDTYFDNDRGGGSKSRRTRRRKHSRKSHHKRASKSHKRRRHSRVARKHKKHTRR